MKKLEKFTALTALVTYVLIVLGAAVRVYDAGMSCPDWPMCYGKAFPFPVDPQYGYTTFQVFLEWFHRFLAAIVGFMLLGIAIWSVKYFKKCKTVTILCFACLFVLFVQVFLGMITIQYSNLHWTVAIHLGNAMILFSLMIATRKRMAIATDSENKKVPMKKITQISLWALLASTFFTMLLGAMVSTSFSGGVCGGLFLCHGELMPADFQQILHMKHRIMAVVTLVLAGLFYVLCLKEDATYKKTAKGVNIIIWLQALVGITTLYSFSHYAEFYKALSVFHLAWGTVIIMALAGALSKVYFGTGGSFHK